MNVAEKARKALDLAFSNGNRTSCGATPTRTPAKCAGISAASRPMVPRAGSIASPAAISADFGMRSTRCLMACTAQPTAAPRC